MDREVEDRSQIRVVIQKPKPKAKSLSSPVIAELEISQPAETIHEQVCAQFMICYGHIHYIFLIFFQERPGTSRICCH